MARSNKDAWLAPGAGDLAEVDVEDVPVKGESVRVRALPAAYSNEASSEALKWTTTPNNQQIATIDTAKLEVLQFAHGVIEPQFSVEEAKQIAEKFGPAFKKVVAEIDRISGVDKEAIEEANRRFRDGEASPNGSAVAPANGAGNDRPNVPARTGVGAREVG